MAISKCDIINYSSTHKQSLTDDMLWLDIRECNDNSDLSSHYTTICQQHQLNNKWILMINPEDDCLHHLAETSKIDTRNILKVHTQATQSAQKNIELALAKGHCSAVILCNPSLKQEDIHQLKRCAKQGKTTCIVLKNQGANGHKKLH